VSIHDHNTANDSRHSEHDGTEHPVSSTETLEAIERLSTERGARFRALLDASKRNQTGIDARAGQIWTTCRSSTADDSERRLVVIIGRHDGGAAATLIVAPVSIETAYRSDLDLVVESDASPLGYRFMVEVWNTVNASPSALGRCLAELLQPHKRFVGLLYRAHLGSAVDRAPLADFTGPAILSDEDPRYRFQQQEIEACVYLGRWSTVDSLVTQDAPDAAAGPARDGTAEMIEAGTVPPGAVHLNRR
jgi:hypothetical protein